MNNLVKAANILISRSSIILVGNSPNIETNQNSKSFRSQCAGLPKLGVEHLVQYYYKATVTQIAEILTPCWLLGEDLPHCPCRMNNRKEVSLLSCGWYRFFTYPIKTIICRVSWTPQWVMPLSNRPVIDHAKHGGHRTVLDDVLWLCSRLNVI